MRIIDQTQALLSAYQHRDAETLLKSALDESPADVDLHAELGLLYCYTQREFEAVPHFEQARGARKFDKLGQILADYFYCRAQMAAKHGIQDAAAEALAARVDFPHGDVGIRLSACLIVKNEADNLDRCLSSLQGICDEVIVVDTGSEDASVAIAEKYGAVIGHFEWIGDFAAARNVSLDMATGHWCLWIDADEELHPEAHATLREALIRPHFAGYYIQIVNFMDSENSENQYVHTPVRLFRHLPEIRFEGRVHEQVIQDFDRHGFVAATLTSAKINHYGYQAQAMREKDKIARTITMLEQEVKDHPRDAFQWFNLANAYCVDRRFSDAERAARIAIHFLEPNAPYGSVTYQILASCLLSQNKVAEAVQACQDAKISGFYTIINQFEYAHALSRDGKSEEALAAIDTCLATEWPHGLSGDFSIKTYKGQTLRAQILFDLGRAEEALEILDEVLAVDPRFSIARYTRAKVHVELKHPREAAEDYIVAAEAPGMGDCLILAGQCYREVGEAERAARLFEEAWRQDSTREDLTAAWLQVAKEFDTEYALAAYEEVLATPLSSAEIQIDFGRLLAEKGQLNESLEQFRQAVERDPANPNGYFNLGDLLSSASQWVVAAEAYEAGLRLQPQHAAGWFALGNCFAHLGHHEGARLAYGQTLLLDPSHPGAQHNLSLIAA